MSNKTKTYTYRGGQKIELDKSPDQMVTRGLAKNLDDLAILKSEQVSSSSIRIKTSKTELEELMSKSRDKVPTHHAYYEKDTGTEFLITDRIFVTFKQAISDEQLDEFAARYALVKKTTYGDRDFLFQLTNHTGMNPVKLVVKLTEEEPLVEMAEHDLNQRMNTYSVAVPSDPAYLQQWHLHTRFNDSDYDERASVLCEKAWDLLDSYGSQEVVIAVADDGCKLDHYDFDSSDKFAEWAYLRGERLINSADYDADPNEMYKQGSNHGTSCCGVIGGEADATLTVGAAPGCSLLPVQWESSGSALFISDSKLLTVLDFIADKADVMSNSWGGVPLSLWAYPVIRKIKDLAQTGGRRGKGIVFLWAAGNENCLIDYQADKDVPYNNGIDVQGGAPIWIGVKTTNNFRNNLVGIPGVMHVAALASTARRSHYSNYGAGISICAPSSNSHTYSRMTVKGLGITTATGEYYGLTHSFGGTSSATPLTAGVAGLVISANPNLSAIEVITILKQTASKDLNFDSYMRTPPASFDPDTSWDVSPVAPFDKGEFVDNGDNEGSWSPWFGYGKVNAVAAVTQALDQIAVSDGQTFSKTSAPDKSIPDNNQKGIKDIIQCDDDFLIAALKVNLDISHTYISDLIISLVAPSGTTVLLHNRTGGSANDIHREFDIQSTPDLHVLSGESAQGKWELHVQDLAAKDRGRLTSWSLDISGQQDTSFVIEESPGIIIPDNTQAGIERTLVASTGGKIGEIEVELDIAHSFISDLTVELVSPDNITVLLHNRTGGSEDNIIKTYTFANMNALQELQGTAIKGDWKLRVADHEGYDHGKLNHWSLKIT